MSSKAIRVAVYCVYFISRYVLYSINENVDGILHIDDLKLFLILFADEDVIFANNPVSLQSKQYCSNWNLKLNVDKTKIMIFENSRPTYNNYDFFLNDTIHFFKNRNWSRT